MSSNFARYAWSSLLEYSTHPSVIKFVNDFMNDDRYKHSKDHAWAHFKQDNKESDSILRICENIIIMSMDPFMDGLIRGYFKRCSLVGSSCPIGPAGDSGPSGSASLPKIIPSVSSQSNDISKVEPQIIGGTAPSLLAEVSPQNTTEPWIIKNMKNVSDYIFKDINNMGGRTPKIVPKDKILAIECDLKSITSNLIPDTDNGDVYIGGSTALKYFLTQLNETRYLGHAGNSRLKKEWTPGDTDIIFLNSKRDEKIKLRGVDIILTTLKTVEELFYQYIDLPCCRVLIKPGFGFIISEQCLYSILFGLYWVTNRIESSQKLAAYMKEIGADTEGLATKYHKQKERIEKYEQRGFVINYVDDKDLFHPLLSRVETNYE